MNIQAFGDKVLLEEISGEQTTESGIIFTTTIETTKARVLSVGSKVSEVVVGDVVFVDWKKCTLITGEKQKVFAKIEDILAVVE